MEWNQKKETEGLVGALSYSGLLPLFARLVMMQRRTAVRFSFMQNAPERCGAVRCGALQCEFSYFRIVQCGAVS